MNLQNIKGKNILNEITEENIGYMQMKNNFSDKNLMTIETRRQWE